MVRIGGPKGKLHTVIGVAKNAPINELGEMPEPYLYMSYWSNFEQEVTFMIETFGDAIALAPILGAELPDDGRAGRGARRTARTRVGPPRPPAAARACALAELPAPEPGLDILACDEFRALAAAIRARLH